MSVGSGSSPATPATPASPRLMVVDDDTIFLVAIKRMLSGTNCTVSLHHEPERALARLRDEAPEILLVDLNMPRMDGIEFMHLALEALDALGARPGEVYLHSAGHAPPETRAAAARLGVELVDKDVVLKRAWLGALVAGDGGRSPPPDAPPDAVAAC